MSNVHFSRKFPLQNLKNCFPKGNFNGIWLIKVEHKYKWIVEIKFEKKKQLFRYDFRDKKKSEQRHQNAEFKLITS